MQEDAVLQKEQPDAVYLMHINMAVVVQEHYLHLAKLDRT
jgi:hypothetical protein